MAIFEITRDNEGKPIDMIIKDVNNAYVEYIGLSRQKVIDKCASVIYGPEYVDNILTGSI